MVFRVTLCSKFSYKNHNDNIEVGIFIIHALSLLMAAFAEIIKETSISSLLQTNTVKILKIGTPEIITIIVLQLEQLDFTVQYCVQKLQTE